MAATKTISLSVLLLLAVLFFASCAGGRRGPSEHQLRQLRPTRGFKEMELQAARNFGKRAVPMHFINSILIELLALEKMKNAQRGAQPMKSMMGPRWMQDGQEDSTLGDGSLIEA